MDRFDCSGWLHVTVAPDCDEMLIKLIHDTGHLAYENIDLPDHWKEYIQEHAKSQTPGQVRKSASILVLC